MKLNQWFSDFIQTDFWPFWCQTTFAEAPDNETSKTDATGHKYLEHLWLDKLRHRHQDISSPGCLPWLFSPQVFSVTSPLRQCAYRLWPAVHHDRRSGESLWLKHTVALLTQTHQSCALKRFESCFVMAQSPTFAVQCKQHQQCAEYPCFDWHMQVFDRQAVYFFRAWILAWQKDAVIPTILMPTVCASYSLTHCLPYCGSVMTGAANSERLYSSRSVLTLCSDGMLESCPGIHVEGGGDHFKSSRPTITDRQESSLGNELGEQCCH